MLVYVFTLCKETVNSYFLDKAVGMWNLCHLDLDNGCVHGVTSKNTHNIALNIKNLAVAGMLASFLTIEPNQCGNFFFLGIFLLIELSVKTCTFLTMCNVQSTGRMIFLAGWKADAM